MRELLPALEAWQNKKNKCALATVVKTYGSSPRPLGSKMAVSEELDFVGSVSGGCVESSVIEESRNVIRTGKPKLLQYGISNETAWDIGLACGGQIEVFIEPFHINPKVFTAYEQVFPSIKEAVSKRFIFACATFLTGKQVGEKALIFPEGVKYSGLLTPDAQVLLTEAAKSFLSQQQSMRLKLEINRETADVFVDVISPPTRLYIIGAVHIAIPLVQMAQLLDFETIVVDPRRVFATRARFPLADQINIDWPAQYFANTKLDAGSYIVFLSHDEKLDNPALQIVLDSQARYVGALGSRKTHAKRVQNLLKMGCKLDQIDRLFAPIGLDIGASTAEEIALAILGEIIAVRNGTKAR